jgi:tetratricopeptide (TPR) repeat protein
MSSLFQDFLKVPAAFLEGSVRALDTGSKMLANGLNAMTRRTGDGSFEAPVTGPRTPKAALSDLGNQIVRIGYITPRAQDEIVTGLNDIFRIARRSLGYRSLNDPRVLAMPLELSLSGAGILADALLKMVTVYSAVGGKRTVRLVRDALELYSDSAVFMSVQYKDLIARYEERLSKVPNDFDTRLELGRMYVKCGLYTQAAHELEQAVENSSTRAAALHDLLVAHHRAGRFAEAVSSGSLAMDANPGNERTRHVLWLASRGLGGYPEGVPAVNRMDLNCGLATPTVFFEDIAARVGLRKTTGGRGSVVFDYNNDGYLDICVAGQYGTCSLYRNNGDGTFTDVSIGAGLEGSYDSFGLVAGDYDNDGFQDLFVTRLGFYPGHSILYHNNGDGTFTDVTEKAGLTTWGPAFSAHWVDYDCDGRLDLFIAYNVAELFDGHFPNRLFHNNGDGTFTDVSEKSGLYSSFTTIGSAWGDYNNDGYPDLFLSSGIGRPYLFRNNGDGTFTDVSAEAGFSDLLFGFICAWVDYDNDGWLDIVQFLWSDHDEVTYTLRNGVGPPDCFPTRIYHNNRDGTFTAKDREIGLDGCWGTMGGNFGDINNDGHLDIVMGNGSPRMERMDPPVVLESDGKRYRNTTFAAGLPYWGKGHGVNFADLFGNGRLSIILPDGGAYPGELLATHIYYPKELPGNYLNVRLRGTKSNRDAIGARITLLAGGGLQMREVNAGSSFGSLPYEQHFGLAKLEKVDALEIRWPSGLRQRFENPPANESIRITEGEARWELTYSKSAPETKVRRA